MAWRPLKKTDPDGTMLARWAASKDKRVDPYWLLAHAMKYAGFDRSYGTMPVMVELLFTIGKGGRVPTRYLLAWVAPEELEALIFLQGHLVERFQLDAPRAQGSDAVAPGGILAIDQPGLAPSWLATVIDDGLPFAHPALLKVNKSLGRIDAPRFASLWDQRGTPPGASAAAHWITSSVPFGRELTQEAMHALIGNTYATLDEAKTYATADYTRLAHGSPHGCGVTQLFAADDVALADRSRREFDGWAPTEVIGVQLPAPAIQDTAGAWLGFYALAALRHAADRATKATKGGPWRMVANLSYGSLAGPHDGSSMFEKAVDELVSTVQAPSCLRITLASGNARGLPIHAQRTVTTGGSGRFRVTIPPDNPRESYCELWLPSEDDDGNPLNPAMLSFTITAPDGAAHAVTCGSAHLHFEGTATKPSAGAVFARKVAQGLDGTMLLLLVRPTRNNSRGDRASAGVWTIDVTSKHSHPVTVHGWIERNDLVGTLRRTQQTRFEADPTDPEHVNPDRSLSHCAHGMEVTVAGAVVQSPGRMSEYTGRGFAGGRMRPDWYAPGDATPGTRGVLVPGRLSGQWTRMTGTSIAAAWVSRWLMAGADPAELRPTTESDRQMGPPMQRTVRGA